MDEFISMDAKDTEHADSVKERNIRVSQVLNSPMNESKRWGSQWMMQQGVQKTALPDGMYLGL